MSELLTLEGRRLGYSNRNSNSVSPKKRRIVKVKPLTCAALAGSAYRYDLEMAGIGSFVSRQARKVKNATKTVKRVATKIAPKPLKPLVKAALYVPLKSIENTSKAVGYASRGQYASALKAQSSVSMIPKSWRNKVVSTAKKTAIGRALVKKASSVDNRVSNKINAQSKKAIVGAITASFGPAAGVAAQKFVPEGASPAKAAIVVDQIVQSPSIQAPTYENVAKAEEMVQQPETKSGSGIGLIAALGAAAMFLI